MAGSSRSGVLPSFKLARGATLHCWGGGARFYTSTALPYCTPMQGSQDRWIGGRGGVGAGPKLQSSTLWSLKCINHNHGLDHHRVAEWWWSLNDEFQTLQIPNIKYTNPNTKYTIKYQIYHLKYQKCITNCNWIWNWCPELKKAFSKTPTKIPIHHLKCQLHDHNEQIHDSKYQTHDPNKCPHPPHRDDKEEEIWGGQIWVGKSWGKGAKAEAISSSPNSFSSSSSMSLMWTDFSDQHS